MPMHPILRRLPALAWDLLVPPRRWRRAADAPGSHRRGLRPDLSPAAVQPQGTPRVTAIILHRNGAHLLEALFASLVAHETWPALDLVLVDHASTDHSLDTARAWAGRLPAGWRLEIVARRGNHSFSWSNNRAAERARGDYILLLNNDIVLDEPVIGRLLAVAQATGGLVGLGQFENVAPDAATGARPWHHIGVRYHWNRSLRFIVPRNAAPRPGDEALAAGVAAMPAATGSILLCARADYLAVGGLDEGYVYGYEDIDLCALFAHRLGRPVLSVNDVRARHGDGATRRTAGSSAARKARNRANKDRLVARWGFVLWRALGPAWLGDDGSARGRAPGLLIIGQPEAAGQEGREDGLAVWRARLEAAGWVTGALARPPGLLSGLLSRGVDVEDTDVVVACDPGYRWRGLRRRGLLLLRVAWAVGRESAWCAHPDLAACDLAVAADAQGAALLRAAGAPRVWALPDLLAAPEPALPLVAARAEGLRVAVRGARQAARRLAHALGYQGVVAWEAPVGDAWAEDGAEDAADVIACLPGAAAAHDARPVIALAEGTDAATVAALARAAVAAGVGAPCDAPLSDLPGAPWPEAPEAGAGVGG